MDMTWDEHYQRCREARGNEKYLRIQAARKRVAQNSTEDWEWLRTSLGDAERKWFVASVFTVQPVPKRLLAPMLRAAVLERDPSYNRAFIDPCLRTNGAKRVCTILLAYLETGTNEEIAGAASAYYHTWGAQPGEDVTELRSRIRSVMLQTFVRNEDLQVRRRIIPQLILKPEIYSEELRPLVRNAIEIARAHPDAYIRHRVEIQLGAGGPYMAIPDTDSNMRTQIHPAGLSSVLAAVARLFNRRGQ
jgi:hypothetical protein